MLWNVQEKASRKVNHRFPDRCRKKEVPNIDPKDLPLSQRAVSSPGIAAALGPVNVGPEREIPLARIDIDNVR